MKVLNFVAVEVKRGSRARMVYWRSAGRSAIDRAAIADCAGILMIGCSGGIFRVILFSIYCK